MGGAGPLCCKGRALYRKATFVVMVVDDDGSELLRLISFSDSEADPFEVMFISGSFSFSTSGSLLPGSRYRTLC